MRLYGLLGTTHAWAHTLTVMCAAGASRERTLIVRAPGLEALRGPGRLSLYLERREGAIEALLRRHRIELLDKPAWDERKRALGERIYR